MIEDDTVLSRLRRWQRGETPGPWYVTFYPTNRCNLDCIMCWRHDRHLSLYEEVSDARFLELVDECAEVGCREWCIVGGGEPLIRASLVLEICERIRRRNMTGILQNNGTLLKAEYARKLIEIDWNGIVCSLDGPTPEINDHLRGEGTFERATAAMARCVALKREMHADGPYLTFCMTLTRHNYKALPDMIEFTHRLGCNCLMAAPALGDWCTEHMLTPDQCKAVPELAARALGRARELGIDVNFEALPVEGRLFRWRDRLFEAALGGRIDYPNALCFDPWHGLVIFPEGRIGPCCCGWHEQAPKITDAPLRELWTGPYLTEARKRIAEGRSLDFCHLCPPLLAHRTIRIRRQMRLADVDENWSSLTRPQRAFYTAWWAAGCLRRREVAGAIKVCLKGRR